MIFKGVKGVARALSFRTKHMVGLPNFYCLSIYYQICT